MHTRSLLMLLLTGSLALTACADGGTGEDNNDNLRTFRDAEDPNGDPGSDAGDPADADAGTLEDSGHDDIGSDEDMGSGADTDVETDTGEDTPDMQLPGPCADIATGQTFDLDSADVHGEYFADAAFDGEGVWVTYTRPATDQVAIRSAYAVRIECDGTMGQPIKLSGDNGRDNIHAAIAAGADTTFAVWVSDDAGSKKYIMLQALKADGTASLAEPADVTPVGGAEVVSDLVWEIDVAALPDDRAILVGQSGPFGEQQIVAQRFLSDGTLEGNGFFPHSDKDVEQKQPTVTADDAGTAYVAWTRVDPQSGTETAVFASVPQNATEAVQNPPPPAGPLTEQNPVSSYADEEGPNGEYFLTFMDQSTTAWNIAVRDGSDFSTANVKSFGTPQRSNFRPDVAGGPEGGVVAWYRYVSSPTDSTLMLNWFEVDAAGNFSASAETSIDTNDPAKPQYGPRIVHVADRTYFVTWSEGPTNADAQVKGRFVQF